MSGINILVLCTGNIGRSPLAQVLREKGLADGLGVPTQDLITVGVVVTSAGTDAPVGHSASARGIAIAAESGLDLTTHHASQLTAAAIRDADYIFAMDQDQLTAVARLDPGAMIKTELLAGEGNEIPDPHYGSDGLFRDVAAKIGRAVKQRVPELLSRINAARD